MTALLASAARSTDPWALHLHVDVILVVGTLVAGYVMALRRLGPALAPAGEPIVSRRQRWQFGTGAALMFVFAFWPIHDIAEDFLFSVHMTQHTVFSLIVTPLLLLGTPAWLRDWVARPVLPLLRKLTRPLPATLLFNGFIAISHAAGWVNYTATHELPHFLAHSALVFVSAVMWLPVIHTLPGAREMSPPVKMIYLFGQSVLPNVSMAFLTFAEAPLYSWYAGAPRITGMSVIEDIQTAGAIMKVIGTLIIWSTIVVMFFRWYERTEGGRDDVLTVDDLQREFARSAPPPGN